MEIRLLSMSCGVIRDASETLSCCMVSFAASRNCAHKYQQSTGIALSVRLRVKLDYSAMSHPDPRYSKPHWVFKRLQLTGLPGKDKVSTEYGRSRDKAAQAL